MTVHVALRGYSRSSLILHREFLFNRKFHRPVNADTAFDYSFRNKSDETASILGRYFFLCRRSSTSRVPREIQRGMSGSNADVCSRRGRFRIHAPADGPLRDMDERALGIRLRVYEYRYSLMPDADATESMPRSCIPARRRRRYLYLLIPRCERESEREREREKERKGRKASPRLPLTALRIDMHVPGPSSAVVWRTFRERRRESRACARIIALRRCYDQSIIQSQEIQCPFLPGSFNRAGCRCKDA